LAGRRGTVCKTERVSRLLVVRHAQSEWNAAGRWQGWSDAPLSEVGVGQARSAGRALATGRGPLGLPLDFIASSDLARARRTAEIVGEEVCYAGSLVIDADLREQDLGEWNGLTNEEIVTRWPAELEARRRGGFGPVPGGEGPGHFAERSMGAIRRLAGGVQSQALVVAHGGVLAVLERALGCWVEGLRHSNLSGWLLDCRAGAEDLQLAPLGQVDLLAMSQETVTGRG